jgi:hypothetical protein
MYIRELHDQPQLYWNQQLNSGPLPRPILILADSPRFPLLKIPTNQLIDMARQTTKFGFRVLKPVGRPNPVDVPVEPLENLLPLDGPGHATTGWNDNRHRRIRFLKYGRFDADA